MISNHASSVSELHLGRWSEVVHRPPELLAVVPATAGLWTSPQLWEWFTTLDWRLVLLKVLRCAPNPTSFLLAPMAFYLLATILSHAHRCVRPRQHDKPAPLLAFSAWEFWLALWLAILGLALHPFLSSNMPWLVPD